jgi:hypothetical protein
MLHSELGDQLRRAREAKNLSLDEAERATGIRKRFLQAMEEGRFDALPGEIQLRGFMRNYAGYVGLNGDDLIAIYERRVRPTPAGPAASGPAPAAPAGKAAFPVQPSPTRLPGPQPVKPQTAPAVQPQPSKAARSAPGAQPQPAPAVQPAWLSRLPAWLTVERILVAIAILMLICIAVLVALLLTSPTNGVAAPASRPAATQTRPAAPTPPPATLEMSATAAPPEAAVRSSAKLTTTSEFVQIALAASEHVWVRVTTDGKTAFEGMFAPSQSLKWEAKEILAVETGNGAGLNVSFNGKSLGAFGPRGQLAARAWTPAGETAVPPKPTAALATPNP